MNEWEDSAPGTYSKMPFAVQKKLEPDMLATTLLHNVYLLQEIRSQQFATILSRIFTKMISTITPSTATENSNSTTQAQKQSASIAQTDLDSKLNTKLQAIARIYRRLLKSGDISDRTPAGKALQSKVVYSFVKLFRDLLDRIGDLAASHITQNTSKDAQNVSKLRATKAKTALASAKDDKTTLKLCRLLITMAASLEASNPMHQNIIDGLLFFLLTRVGQLLFVFSDDTITTSTATLIQAQNKTTTSHLSQGNFIPEGPHLIFLLTHLTPLIARSTSLVLAEKVKMTLQHTLLNAVFDAQTGEFVHALREPCFPSDNLDVDADIHTLASRDDGNVGDWYKHQIWECLGWNVHIAWPEEISPLQQFRAPIPLPSASTKVSAPAQLSSHSHRSTPSPRKTPILQISPESRRNVSMTPHYPSRRPFAKTLGRKDRWDKGSGRKRKRVGKVVVSERGREESMKL
jgi:hypothetical protein